MPSSVVKKRADRLWDPVHSHHMPLYGEFRPTSGLHVGPAKPNPTDPYITCPTRDVNGYPIFQLLGGSDVLKTGSGSLFTP